MPVILRAAVGVAALVTLGSAAHAEDMRFDTRGSAHYEKPAPLPVSAALPAPVVAKTRKAAHEMAARVHKKEVPVAVAAHDAAAPTPVADATPAASGPVEAGAPTLHELVSKHARANGVPENLAAAVVNIESRFNPRARGGSALGLMQIQYNTARSVGYVGGVAALLQPETNLRFGMKVLADAYKASKGDLCMTLARYQSGHLVTHASAANRAYCAKAKTLMARAS